MEFQSGFAGADHLYTLFAKVNAIRYYRCIIGLHQSREAVLVEGILQVS